MGEERVVSNFESLIRAKISAMLTRSFQVGIVPIVAPIANLIPQVSLKGWILCIHVPR